MNRTNHPQKLWIGLAVLLAGLNLIPLLWMFLLAASRVHVETGALQLDLAGFRRLFTALPAVRWALNSFLVSVAITAGNLLFCSMAGYAFAKKQAPGLRALFWLCLATMMVPAQVTVIPLFLMMSGLGLANTYIALIAPTLATAFGVFLMRQFISTLPTSLFEAARLDGCNEWQTFTLIVLPLVRPALAVLGIFAFTSSWNDFLWPLVICNRRDMWTLPVGLASLQQEFNVDTSLLMAGAAFAAIPMIILFFALQKHFLSGLTVGAVKG
jgi:multiple sugar transport system permease protein